VKISSVFWLIIAGVQILLGDIHIFQVQQVNEIEIGSIRHLIDDTRDHHFNSGHCRHEDWFKG
jgi:hypothetical protein